MNDYTDQSSEQSNTVCAVQLEDIWRKFIDLLPSLFCVTLRVLWIVQANKHNEVDLRALDYSALPLDPAACKRLLLPAKIRRESTKQVTRRTARASATARDAWLQSVTTSLPATSEKADLIYTSSSSTHKRMCSSQGFVLTEPGNRQMKVSIYP